jgi:hypothetical protein
MNESSSEDDIDQITTEMEQDHEQISEEPTSHITEVENASCRVYCVSDIHTDHKRNWKIITSWKQEHYNRETGTIKSHDRVALRQDSNTISNTI